MIKHLLSCAFAIVLGSTALAAETLKVAVTTSFHNSGLADVLLPEIAKDLDLELQLLVVGTGQAIKLGEQGDVDAILVHSRAAEDAFVDQGFGTHRREIMYNDFVIIGHSQDPALAHTAASAANAFAQIAASEAKFISRGDESGTHKKERALWKSADLDPDTFGAWYNEVGAGMGAALNTASGMNAYILSDRASWLNFGNKGELALLYSGDPVLFNQYAFLPVNPERHPHIETALNEKLESWLVSDKAKELINAYKINGEALFVFNATR